MAGDRNCASDAEPAAEVQHLHELAALAAI